jgi:pSer/pThr/pTyr-binding forkhead associated (FHA) protein
MVQLKLVSGKMAGTIMVARHFPFEIGRATTMDLRLEDDGVWEQHLELSLDPSRGFLLKTRNSALARVNGQPLAETLLRNGDLIEIGAAKISFWLGETRQTSLGLREWSAWAGCGVVLAVQIYLIYRLAR